MAFVWFCRFHQVRWRMLFTLNLRNVFTLAEIRDGFVFHSVISKVSEMRMTMISSVKRKSFQYPDLWRRLYHRKYRFQPTVNVNIVRWIRILGKVSSVYKIPSWKAKVVEKCYCGKSFRNVNPKWRRKFNLCAILYSTLCR